MYFTKLTANERIPSALNYKTYRLTPYTDSAEEVIRAWTRYQQFLSFDKEQDTLIFNTQIPEELLSESGNTQMSVLRPTIYPSKI